MKKSHTSTIAFIFTLIMIITPFTGCGTMGPTLADMDKETVSLDQGSNWALNKTTSLTGLTIAKGATITAPEGYSITMTVDGVETPIAAGSYSGNIVLTVAKDIVVEYRDTVYKLRAAIDVENGKYAADKSVAATVIGGEVTDTFAKDVKITSVGENFNGIIARGDSRFSYSILNPEITLTGNGGNDFVGYGAAIMTDGKAELTVNNASIITNGAIRSAVVVRGDSTVRVNDSSIEVHNGTLPEGITEPWAGGRGKVMMAVPWMLGLAGNCRATNLIDNGTVYYNNTRIRAQGWGALSTDATKKVRLYVTKSVVETIESGYGAYSIGDSHDYFSDCEINVADMALIMAAEGSGTFTDGTVVNSRRFGVMMHGGSGGTLTIDKGSVFNTRSTVIQVKSSSTNIIVDNAELNSESGVILQSMANDDPNMAGGGPGGPGGGIPTGVSMPGSGGLGGPGGEMPGSGGPGGPPGAGGGGDVIATFRNIHLKGDIINGNTTSSDVIANFENAAITGAITTALTSPVGEPSYEKYYLIGEVINSYCATDEEYGMKVSLDKNSSWVVDETSFLTSLTIAEGATITAPEGHSLTLTVDGIETPIQPGTYKGDITLTLTKEIPVVYQNRTYKVRMAVDVEDGKYVAEKSVAAAVVGGNVTDSSAEDISITSVGPNFNGIMIKGDSRYSIINPVIKLTGNGGSDFAGIGAAIVSEGTADVTVNNATIINHGVIRSAVVVKDNSNIHINDSYIEVHDGILPDDVEEPWNGNNKYGMIAVPWMLGLTGNCRATNLTGYGTAYYNNSHIKAQAWGALSTDACRDVKLYVTNSHIETVESGYGAYADGAYDKFSGCLFDVTDYALIMTGGTGIFTDKTVVNSGRFGVMFHGSANLTINKGSVFNTKKAVIQVKSAYPTIVVDNAELISENGLILQAMVNDDPNKMPGAMFGGGMPGGMPGGPPGGMGGAPGGDMPSGEGARGGDMPGGGMPGGGMPGVPGGSGDVSATFRNVTLNGDIISSMTTMGDVKVSFESATITGAITTAVATPVGEPSYEKYYLIGEVNNSYCATDDEYGMKISLDKSSSWIVEETSFLTSLTIAEGAVITAPRGYGVTMTVDGVKTPLGPGTYEGKIVLTVTSGA